MSNSNSSVYDTFILDSLKPAAIKTPISEIIPEKFHTMFKQVAETTTMFKYEIISPVDPEVESVASSFTLTSMSKTGPLIAFLSTTFKDTRIDALNSGVPQEQYETIVSAVDSIYRSMLVGTDTPLAGRILQGYVATATLVLLSCERFFGSGFDLNYYDPQEEVALAYNTYHNLAALIPKLINEHLRFAPPRFSNHNEMFELINESIENLDYVFFVILTAGEVEPPLPFL